MDTDILITAGGILLLLVLSAFFSGSETAMTAASRAHIHHLAKQGDRRAGMISALRAHKQNMIGAILIGNNLVNILASVLATSVMLNLFGDAGLVYATIAMTLLVVIFSEVLPKSYAITHAERVALAVAPVLGPVVRLLTPAAHAVNIVVRAVLRLLGADGTAAVNLLMAESELRGAIDLHAGDESGEARGMLSSILDLAEVEVREIMTHRKNVATLDASASIATIVAQVLESPYTRFPLWQGEPDNIVGTLHAKALLRAVQPLRETPETLDIEAIATPPWFIPETTSLLDQLQVFRRRHEHFALVVDEYGALKGVVTLEDILEEIVGEISDEIDVPVPGVHIQTDGAYMVAGSVTLRDLNREFGWSLPDEQAATIAGLLLYESRQIPKVGQVFNFYGFRFKVMRRQRNQITSILIRPPQGSTQPEH